MGKRGVFLLVVIVLVAICGGYLFFKSWSSDFAFHTGKYFYYQERDYEAALKKYEQVKRSSAHYATAQRYIGYNIYGREWGQWKKGISYLEEALRVAPDDPKVLEDVGRAFVRVGRVDEGADLLRRANTDVAQTALAQLSESGN